MNTNNPLEDGVVRALLVEDSDDDAFLVLRALQVDGIRLQHERVRTKAGLESALDRQEFDVVLADYRLPQFSGLEAVGVVRERALDLPVIIVSGTIGEEAAAALMRAGARDFVAKDRLHRLGPAIRRELSEAAARRSHRGAEAELKLEQQRFRALVERSAEVISVVDRDGTIIYGSPTAETLLGYGVAEFVGQNMFGFVHPDELPAARASFARMLAQDGALERQVLRLRHKDGHWSWTEVTGQNLFHDVSIRGVVINFHDISERRAAEDALRDNEALYRATFDEAPIGIAHLSLDGRFLRVNREFAAMLGYTAEEVLKLEFADVLAPDEIALDWNINGQLIGGDLQSHTSEKRYLRRDGTQVWGLRTVSLRRDEAGKPLHFIGIVNDITRRKQVELQLQRLQERYEAILDHSPAIIYLKDSAGRYMLTNRRFAEKFLAPGQSAIGLRADEIFSGRFAALDVAHDHVALAAEGPVTEEITINERDGAHVYISIKFRLRDTNGRTYAIGGIATDITDRKKIEQQLLQAQKMEAFGQLAGGVAHDFNNILAVLLMHFNLIGAEPDVPAKVKMTMKELEQAATRASNIVRQLLIFSRRHELAPQVLDLNRTIEAVCKMLKRFVGENIEFTFTPAAQPLWVEADASMVEQVVMNLCVNARDAMPQGGRLGVTLSAERRAGPNGDDAHPEGDYACLAVSDTGFGMDEVTKARIFEPFFTTKPVGKGTGLGLATVHGIAEQHRGWVEVETAMNAGSTFRVYFPITRRTQSALADLEDAMPQGTGRILLVEDEDAVRTTAGACLRRVGYDVVEAPDGIQAMMRWDEEKGNFDLLISDMIMPGGITGYQLAEQLLRSRAELKVILMTGYSPGTTNWNAPTAAGVTRMTKPFSAGKLLRTVRDVLQPPPAQGDSRGVE